MPPGLQLSQRLALSQVLAPQLQQSLALLQAPTLELKAMVEAELQQNPVLEEVSIGEMEQQSKSEDGEKPADSLDPAEPPADVTFDPATEKSETAPVDDFQAEFEKLAQLDQEWREHFSQTNIPLRQSAEEEERRQFMFDSLTASTSLQESLLEQMRTSDISEDEFPIAETIIGNIDDHGYLKASIEELAMTLSVPPEDIKDVLAIIQTFDPPGVGARDLQECLLQQLERAGQRQSVEYRIVSEYMEALGKRRIPEIARGLDLSVAAVQESLARISRLEPRPGRSFLTDNQQYILPEVFVQKVGDDFTVTTNNEQIPHLRISNTYKDLMARSAVDTSRLESSFANSENGIKGALDLAVAAIKSRDEDHAVAELKKLAEHPELNQEQLQAINHAIVQVREKRAFIEARNYIREKIRAGKFLIKSLDQRQQTILNIGREIVSRQRDFMEKGVACLKPMTMVQVAEVVGVHETTVSRAVSGKYMQTPQGIFEMKYFFTAGIQTTDGAGMSNTSVKDMIAEIFKKEEGSRPLSDQEVVKMLADKGIVIARRTVAKYRSELNILPSNLRKIY
ncbi:MAG TPA: RNA polymerase sigma-54 factor [Dongiaceae bacterium]|jgi:RNA polymerase sigma-54 factor|nr:RNA polymerase sigma-54 factor [Dongiaceae bacterium]